MNGSNSVWGQVVIGVPQGSVLGSIRAEEYSARSEIKGTAFASLRETS